MSRIAKAAVLTATVGAALAGAAGPAMASSDADGAAVGSPGVISGNNLQAPVHIPVNLCGNSFNFLAAINPTFGNTCVNAG
ncbi:chaplin [Embleya sp. NPDC005575]|uniref:chaplin n=1 Tax=Embleya sp. NPDC005575 TaxID=3156892 RepID=UPI0033AB3E45